MSTEKKGLMSAFNHKRKALLSPQNRVAVFMVIAVVVITIGGITAGKSLLGEDDVPSTVSVGGVKTKSLDVEAGADKSEHYKKEVRAKNKVNYDKARLKSNGVSMPFTFNEAAVEETGNGDIDTCGCKIDDDQLLAALKRVGGAAFGNQIDAKQIARSSLYVASDGQLLSENGEAILFNGEEVFMDAKGQLIDSEGNPILDENGNPLFMGKNGEILDVNGNKVNLKGRLTTASGKIIGSDGKIINAEDDMRRISSCDIYATKEGQMASVDGKSLKFGGQDVFRMTDSSLVTRDGKPVSYASKDVYLSNSGRFIDFDNKTIVGNAILFTHDGIVIDHTCMLQGELKDFSRIGLSDIYITSEKELVDHAGRPLFHDGKETRIDVNRKLLNANGNVIRNGATSEVYITKQGKIVDPSETSVTDGALLLTIEHVGIDANGKMLNTKGNLERLGDSDIYMANSGILADSKGRPLTHKKIHVKRDDETQLHNEAGNKILDRKGEYTFLSKEGFNLYSDDSVINEVGLLSNYDGVPFGPNGKLIDPTGVTEQLYHKAGHAVFSDESIVLREKTKQLHKSGGAPVLNAKKTAVYMRNNLSYTDENKHVIKNVIRYAAINEERQVLDATGSPVIASGNSVAYLSTLNTFVNANGAGFSFVELNTINEALPFVLARDIIFERIDGARVLGDSDLIIASDGLLLGKDGKPVLYNGKRVYIDENGQMFDEEGNAVLDSSGQPVFVDDKGNFIDANGNAINETGLLTTSGGVLIGSNGSVVDASTIKQYGNSDLFKTIDGKLVDKSGKAIKWNGENVKVGAGGALYTLDGRPVVDSKGNKVYLDENGKLVDKNGNLIEESGLLETNDGVLIGSDGEKVNKGGKLTRIGNSNLYRAADGTIVDADGKRVNVDGQTMKIDEKGRLTNKYGVPMRINGKDVYVGENGRLTDRDGNPLLDENGRAMFLDGNGNIVNEDGDIISTEGNRIMKRDPRDERNKIKKSPNRAVTTGSKIPTFSNAGRNDKFTVGSDGSVRGADGKKILVNGQEAFVDEKGRLVDKNGKPILDAEGNEVFLDKSGNFINSKGEMMALQGGSIVAKEASSGFSVGSDGKLHGVDGKKVMINGQEAFVGRNGQLVDKNGRPILDKNGNSLFLDETGSIVNSKGEKMTVKGGQIGAKQQYRGFKVAKDGGLLGSDGKEIIINGKKAFINAQGQLIDAEGNLILDENGMPLHLDKNGNIVNSAGEKMAIEGGAVVAKAGVTRFKVGRDGVLRSANGEKTFINGKEVFVGADGQLLDKNGDAILDDNGNAIYMEPDGSIVNSKGEKLSIKGGAVATIDNVTGSSVDSFSSTDLLVDTKDPESMERLQARYDTLKSGMRQEFVTALGSRTRLRTMNLVPVGGDRDSGLSKEKAQILSAQRLAYVSQESSKFGVNIDGEIIGDEVTEEKSGVKIASKADVLYGTLESSVNSDYPGPILVAISGGQMDGARLIGSFARFEDRVVIEFDSASLPDGRTVQLTGVAIDPSTSYAALASDVDHHYLYRFGGLFLSSFISGYGQAISESRDLTQVNDATGGSTVVSGIDDDQLIYRALSEVGETFAKGFEENINRVPTVIVDQGTPIGIMLTSDALASGGLEKEEIKAVVAD